LDSFRQTEIRSTMMGIPITITEEVIAKACRVAPTGRFLWNITGKHPLMSSYTSVVLKGDSTTKLVNIDNNHRMLLKFLTECFLQKGGGSDQPSADHKLVLYFLASFNKINLPRYIMHHLCWAIKEGIRNKRKQIPCGSLLSEIFSQGKILEILRRNKLDFDNFLKTRTGKMINGKTLQNMKIIKKFSPSEKDLKESTAPTKLMTDFPPIYQTGNPEALAMLVADYAKESGIRMDTDVPAVVAELPLFKPEGRGLLLMLVQKHLVLKPRSQGRTLLMHQLLTFALLLCSRGKEEEKLLLLTLKKSMKKLERKGLRR